MPASLVIILAAALAVSPAAAREARGLVERSLREYDVGEIAKALQDARAAYLLDPLPALLFNLGQCHRALGEWEEAERLYRAYLRHVPGAKNRPLVEKLIAEMAGRVSAAKARPTGQTAPAAAPKAPEQAARTASLASQGPPRGKLTLAPSRLAAGGEVRGAGAPRAPAAPAAAVTAPPPARHHRALAWGLASGAAAGAAVAVAGVVEDESYGWLAGQARRAPDWTSFQARSAQAQADRGHAQAWQIAAIAGAVLAAALGVGAGVAW